ncbi:SMI1/KNR4 family protein [Aquabacterium sp. A7-Y]|uniref:SMI1/KNR4 family protein n=1 Tax=Aquabacterium sp. A7-Y TaxID=1349605 RepID=UPI00223CE793|nr:SMI1/KNR4 family protein [Aquabacterium sp. A7-Y]MCW7536418.1 SMI1/KNR4 family protein [Aquabacterium sp. A7-Y]
MISPHQLDAKLRLHGFSPRGGVVAPGVPSEALEELEHVTGVELPPAFRELYSYSCRPFLDWVDPHGDDMPAPIECFETPLAWDEVLPEWQLARELERDMPELGCGDLQPGHVVRPCFYWSGWLPIARDATGCVTYIDTDPGPAGVVGQIFMQGPSGGPVDVLAANLGEYFDRLVYCLDAGLIVAKNGEWLSSTTGELVHQFKAEVDRAAALGA